MGDDAGRGFGPGGWGGGPGWPGGRGGFGPGFGGGGRPPWAGGDPAAWFGSMGFGPRGWGGPGGRRRAGRGDIRLAVLAVLAEAPSNGYGVMKTIAARTEDAWTPSAGSIYPILAQLVDEELIAGEGQGRSVDYALTGEGRTYVEEHRERIDAVWDTAPSHGPWPGSETIELFSSIAELAKAAKQLRSAPEAQQRAAIKEVDAARRAIYRILAEEEPPEEDEA
ncbi:PadR family transcriptional regulator [Tersicoccus sp. MR15.9]|uniref:PadR family transcriptional regulator n=1 Tax=Tersicoccus mangrovi TaxID=3121635 RepID=UPI002FE50C03